MPHVRRLHPPAPMVTQEILHRCATFLYEVVCAFVIQDLDALIQRHMRKAAQAFLKGGVD